MKNIGFLLDMDGVIYSGTRLIPGAVNFITKLRNNHIPYRFLTNNSQRARRDVAVAADQALVCKRVDDR